MQPAPETAIPRVRQSKLKAITKYVWDDLVCARQLVLQLLGAAFSTESEQDPFLFRQRVTLTQINEEFNRNHLTVAVELFEQWCASDGRCCNLAFGQLPKNGFEASPPPSPRFGPFYRPPTPRIEQPHDQLLLPLLWLNPNQVIADKEKCSKLLDPSSCLYKECTRMRTRLLTTYPGSIHDPPRMDFHLELIEWPNHDDAVLVDRAKSIQGTIIDCRKKIDCGKAIALEGPVVPGYGPTHLTLAYFPNGIPGFDQYPGHGSYAPWQELTKAFSFLDE